MLKEIQVVCAVIRDSRGRILVARRSMNKPLGGLWEFPGGKVEIGELPEAALRREIMEELGVSLDRLEPLEPTRHDDGSIVLNLIPFAAESSGETITLHEHSEVRWLFPHEMSTLDWAPADFPIIRRLQKTCHPVG